MKMKTQHNFWDTLIKSRPMMEIYSSKKKKTERA